MRSALRRTVAFYGVIWLLPSAFMVLGVVPVFHSDAVVGVVLGLVVALFLAIGLCHLYWAVADKIPESVLRQFEEAERRGPFL